MKKYRIVFATITISLLIIVLWFFQKPQDNSRILKTENTVLDKPTNNNKKGVNFKEDNKLYAEVYNQEARSIDDKYNEFLKNKYPVIPLDNILNNELKTKEDVNKYLNEILEDVERNVHEILEISLVCNSQPFIQNRLKKTPSESESRYYSVLFEKCKLISGENDVFFVAERMAEQGDVIMQLKYMGYLNNAITRNVLNPKANPLEYLSRRDKGINWLHQLASKGVVSAYSILARTYYFGNNIEKDYALSYFYAALANKYDLNSQYDSSYLNFVVNNLTDKEYKRIERMSGGEFP